MASTQYQIFCRYYHSSVNRVVTNDLSVEWKPFTERPKFENPEKDIPDTEFSYKNPKDIILYNSLGKVTTVYENFWLRPYQGVWSNTAAGTASLKANAMALDNKYQQVIVDGHRFDHPKYDMLFVYSGIKTFSGASSFGEYAPLTSRPARADVIYEKMERLNNGLTPWFLYSTMNSLNAIMKKAEELVAVMGTDNVLIGKVVNLNQYIEIV